MDLRKMLEYIGLGKLTEGVPPVPFYKHHHPHWVQIFQCGYLGVTHAPVSHPSPMLCTPNKLTGPPE